ncbi:MAG: hypothetical protein WD396_03710 [Pseudohongiellaceae bacterium]
MHKRLPLLTLTLLVSGLIQAQETDIPRTGWGVPDFQGYWRNNTVMPFQRARELGDQRAFTEEEARRLEREAQARVEQDNEPLDPNRPAPAAEALPPVGNYDLFWTDRGMFLPTIDGEYRTSAIIDPANGRIPERIEGFAPQSNRSEDGPEGRGLGERCLLSFGNSSGPVMTPVMYNSHFMIHQAPGYVVITVEMINDARIIKIGAERDEQRSAAQQRWMGDSIGRWEGDTLIVETKNFNPWQNYMGAPTDNLTVIETFRFENPDKLIYGFTVDDPTVYQSQWSGEMPITRMDEPIYEYACHEGNYGIIGILAGARRLEVMEELGIERQIEQ